MTVFDPMQLSQFERSSEQEKQFALQGSHRFVAGDKYEEAGQEPCAKDVQAVEDEEQVRQASPHWRQACPLVKKPPPQEPQVPLVSEMKRPTAQAVHLTADPLHSLQFSSHAWHIASDPANSPTPHPTTQAPVSPVFLSSLSALQ